MTTHTDRQQAQQEAQRLEEPAEQAADLARRLGLEPYDVNYWVVDHEDMNELIAYGGFPDRYPHWRWGMKYDHQQKKDQVGSGKAFEIVNNDDPANAFLQESNDMADQKAVITHVEAHADFFANNEWFAMFGNDETDATAMLARHADTIQSYMDDPDIDREEVEKFIDNVTCIQDTIDQYQQFPRETDDETDTDTVSLEDSVENLGLADDVEDHIFDEDWYDDQQSDEMGLEVDPAERDILQFLADHGKAYDADKDRAVEMDDWKQDVLDILLAEAHYFAPQKMTQVCNEGWASYWESLMMADENFAAESEMVTYADHMSKVLGAPGMNPYKLGMELWEYVENKTNRNEVIDKLLRVDGISWRNLLDTVDMDHVLDLLEPRDEIAHIDSDSLDGLDDDRDQLFDWETLATLDNNDRLDVLDTYPWKALTYEGLAERHYSLVKPQNRSFLTDITRSQLEERARYILDADRYDTVEEAIDDVDRTAGWDRMFDVRASHNDVTLIDEFLTEEFVTEAGYFAYEYSHATGDYRVSSTDYKDVKKKLLLQSTNFGKPTIIAYDDNFKNQGELLIGHQFNGIMLDMDQATTVLERLFELWGRPVNLATIIKDYDEVDEDEVAVRMGIVEAGEPEMREISQRVRYDGDDISFHPLEPAILEEIDATELDYDTVPSDWK